jgi:cobalamin-dependent methionine synthase I
MVHHIQQIPVQLPEKEIYSRMKYNIHKTDIDEKQKNKIDGIIKDAYQICLCSGLWQRVDIKKENDNIIMFNNEFSVESRQLFKLLKDSNSVVFMAVTAGLDIMKAIEEKTAAKKTTESLIYESVGSETADAAMDWLQSYINQQLLRSGETLTKFRYSPGYGDLSLEFQKNMDNILNLSTIDVTLNDRLILKPEKSVTAIAGII